MGTFPTETAKIAFFAPAGVKGHFFGDFLSLREFCFCRDLRRRSRDKKMIFCSRDKIELSRDKIGRQIKCILNVAGANKGFRVGTIIMDFFAIPDIKVS